MPDDRELDVTLAKLTGWTVEAVYEAMSDEMAYRVVDPDGTLLDNYHCGPETALLRDSPHFTTSLDAHAEYSWPVIERKGLWDEYILELADANPAPGRVMRITGDDITDTVAWVLLSSALDHTRTAIAVLKETK